MNAVTENSATLESAPNPADAAPNAKVLASIADLPELQAQGAGKPGGSLDSLLDVSVSVSAELGRTTLSIADILKLDVGSVIGLDRNVSEPVALLVQGVPFARGEVVVIDHCFAIRIREIIDTKFGKS
jgi:flagellar motor switch protein FliN/FliY